MKDWKPIAKKILYPHGRVIIILTVICAAALTIIFVKGYDTHPISCAVYFLSAYTTTILCIFFAKVLPEKYRKARKLIYAHPIGNRFMTDPEFTTHVSLYASLAVNLFYVATNAVLGFLYRSAWFIVLAFYYAILAVMRFLLVRFVNRIGIGNDRFRELRRSRLCGIILLTINLALSGSVLMMLYQNKEYEYHGMMIYIMALYTFYITAAAIANLVRYRRLGSPVMSAAKIITMAASLVSMLSLTTAMLSEFGGDTSPEKRRIIVAATGAGVSIIVIAMSVYTIAHTTKEIKLIRNNGS